MSSKLNLTSKELVILVAPRGTGKTTLSNRIQEAYGEEKVAVVHLDEIFEKNTNLFGMKMIFGNSVIKGLTDGKCVIIDALTIELEDRLELIRGFEKYAKKITILVILRSPKWCLKNVLNRPEGHISKEDTAEETFLTIMDEHEAIDMQLHTGKIAKNADRVIVATGKQIDDLLKTRR